MEGQGHQESEDPVRRVSDLRDYADAVDKDRGYQTGLTVVMRRAADEIERLVAERDRLAAAMDSAVLTEARLTVERADLAARLAEAEVEVERLRDKWEPDTDEPLPGPPSWEMLDKANGRWLAAEARCATLEAALREIADVEMDGMWPLLISRMRKVARVALAAADRPEPCALCRSAPRHDGWHVCKDCGMRPRVAVDRPEGFCGRTDFDPHRPHHWSRLPDGSYGDYDDESRVLVWCPGAADRPEGTTPPRAVLSLDEYQVANLRTGLQVLRTLGLDTGDWLGEILNRLPACERLPNVPVTAQVKRAHERMREATP